MASRLSSGGTIDRAHAVTFRFNGKPVQGFRGDTVASALIANNINLTARSFKYHRPRGIIGSGIEEPATFVETLGQSASANQPATTLLIEEGLDVRSVNCWPSPGFDLMSINRIFSRMLPAAFYYKTFKWPNWHWYEPAIRKAAGLASAPEKANSSDHYETRHAHCDVLIIGAGPAGLSAARESARSGVSVILVDSGRQAGGSLHASLQQIEGRGALEWVDEVSLELSQNPQVIHLQNTTAWAYRENNLVIVNQKHPEGTDLRARTWRVRAKRVIVASGAIERSMVFANNDLPGVMLCSAVSCYINQYAVVPASTDPAGKGVVVYTNNNSAGETVAHLLACSVSICAIVDTRSAIESGDYPEELAGKIYSAHQVVRAHGNRRIKAVTIMAINGGRQIRLDCDLLVMSGGWSPTVHLFSQARGSLQYDAQVAAFVPRNSLQKVVCAGGAAGVFTTVGARQSGIETAKAELKSLGHVIGSNTDDLPSGDVQTSYAIEPLWHSAGLNPGDKAFVDIQNDVTLADVQLAIREGYSSVEHVKRYTTAGMGMDQGRVGNVNVIGAIAMETGLAFEDIGTTTFRAPYSPIEFGALAGAREGAVVLPYRHTPATSWHQEAGACMYESGARWRRPGYYPLPDETFEDTVNREARAVRTGVGVYDGSPLGKFDIKGPDALRFVNYLYTNSFDKLGLNSGRYGIMLSDDGLILDDGVCFNLGPDHFLVTTSTGHADAVNRHMEYVLQVEKPDWKVMLTTLTSQWCNATICGPDARKVLEALDTDINTDAEAFPFMTLREGQVSGIPARVCRVSFTGELSYEINVAPRHMLKLWSDIMTAGQAYGITPVGSEANHVLRVEKGFLSLGHEADGTTDPFDLGFSWIMSKAKPDHIGKQAVELRRRAGRHRRELVGLLTVDPDEMIPEGAPLTPNGEAVPSEGLVTACVWSVANERSVALALLLNGRERMGEKVTVRIKDKTISAVVTQPCFYDPDGERLKNQ